MSNRWLASDVPTGSDYDERFDRLAQSGHDVHGEASFVSSFHPTTVLDAGCGTGRVAIELNRRGVHCAGIDIDDRMLEVAVAKEPAVEWFQGDLATVRLRDNDGKQRRFDLVVAAGNVMIFVEPGTEANVVANLARHTRPGGLVVAGFQLTRGRYGISEYDRDCVSADLELVSRFSSWSRDPWSPESGYAVSVYRQPRPSGVQVT